MLQYLTYYPSSTSSSSHPLLLFCPIIDQCSQSRQLYFFPFLSFVSYYDLFLSTHMDPFPFRLRLGCLCDLVSGHPSSPPAASTSSCPKMPVNLVLPLHTSSLSVGLPKPLLSALISDVPPAIPLTNFSDP